MYTPKRFFRSIVVMVSMAVSLAMAPAAIALESIHLPQAGVPATAKLVGEPTHYFAQVNTEVKQPTFTDEEMYFIATLRSLDSTHERSLTSVESLQISRVLTNLAAEEVSATKEYERLRNLNSNS